jgi:GTP-binding protein
MKYNFKNPKFIKTALWPKDYPTLKAASGQLMAEIAVAGRSNVGKSSLLNDLFQRKGMVKTSSTPGKTQAINFFTLDEMLSFVDLPGYGYAEVPASVRKNWGPMVQGYLEKRAELKLILFLFDVRRTPTDEDRQFLEWAAQAQKAVILVLTKVDKLTTNEKRANTQKILKAFDTENLQYVHYSVTKSIGRHELIKMMEEALEEESLEEESDEEI